MIAPLTLDFFLGPFRAATANHLYEPAAGGSAFRTELFVGPTMPVLGPLLTKVMRTVLFTDELIHDWLTHNVEETGETEQFVPILYTEAHKEKEQ